MEHQEKERLLRRILSRRSFDTISFNTDNIYVTFLDPQLDVMAEADHRYQTTLDVSLHSNMMSIDEAHKLLIKKGLWTSQHDAQLASTEQSIKNMTKMLGDLQYKPKQRKVVQDGLVELRRKQEKLLKLKNKYFPMTAEYYAQQTARRFILSKIATVSSPELLEDLNFLDHLVVCYYSRHIPSEVQIRELARSEPWRLYWAAAKSTGSSLFHGPIADITEIQYMLLTWTYIYDFAYESTNRPSYDIINDDDAFDIWHEQEIKRIDNENKTNKAGQPMSSSGVGGSEMFVMADKEAAKDVYNLNDADGKRRVAQRQKALQTHGRLSHSQLPDVKTDLQIAANAAVMKKGRTR